MRVRRRGQPGRLTLTLAVVAAFFLPGVMSIAPASATSACDIESTKFVFDSASPAYFGNRGAVFAYDHHPMCNGAGTGQSFFMRLTNNYSFVETGLSQYPWDPVAYTHAWVEAGNYIGNGQYDVFVNKNLDSCCLNGGAGILTTGTTYVFELQNGPGTTWDVYIAHANNPDGAAWKHIYGTPSTAAYRGYAESESSRYGGADAFTHASKLEALPTFATPPWIAWGHLGCDYPVDSQTDWYALKISNQEWYNNPGTPGPGVC